MLTHTFRGNRLLSGALVLVAVLIVTLLTPTRADATVATKLAIIQVGTAPPPTEGAREFQVTAGQGVDVVVQAQTATGSPGIVSLLSNQQVRLTTTGPDAATFSYTATLKALSTSVTFKGVKWTTPADGVVLTASIVGSSSVAPDSATGNVVASGATVPANTAGWSYNGQTVVIGQQSDPTCEATAQNPVCVYLEVPSATTAQYIGFAPCDATITCLPGSNAATWLAGVNAAIVNFAHPAKIVVIIDKSIRPRAGASQIEFSYQITPGSPFRDLKSCDIAVDADDACSAAQTSLGNGDRKLVGRWWRDAKMVVK